MPGPGLGECYEKRSYWSGRCLGKANGPIWQPKGDLLVALAGRRGNPALLRKPSIYSAPVRIYAEIPSSKALDWSM